MDLWHCKVSRAMKQLQSPAMHRPLAMHRYLQFGRICRISVHRYFAVLSRIVKLVTVRSTLEVFRDDPCRVGSENSWKTRWKLSSSVHSCFRHGVTCENLIGLNFGATKIALKSVFQLYCCESFVLECWLYVGFMMCNCVAGRKYIFIGM